MSEEEVAKLVFEKEFKECSECEKAFIRELIKEVEKRKLKGIA